MASIWMPIGSLFGSKTKAVSRSETLVMITPTVIESAVDLKEISVDMEKEFSKVPPLKISSLNKAGAVTDTQETTEE